MPEYYFNFNLYYDSCEQFFEIIAATEIVTLNFYL